MGKEGGNIIVNRERGQGTVGRGGGKGMHRLGKKGTYISHKHHRLLLEGNEGREKREGNRGKGTLI